MSPQQTPRRAPAVVRPDEDRPLGDVGGRVRNGLGDWGRSPVLDFYGLICVGTLLIGTGLVMVLSSSSVVSIAKGDSPFAGLLAQGKFALIGLVGLLVAAFLPPRTYERFAWVLLGLGIALQCLVHVPGIGVAAGGNTNWIRIAGQTLQPSELLKLALAVWLGAILTRKRPLLHRTMHLVIPVVPVIVVALGLVLLGHDLGTMMIMAMLVAGSLWIGGVPRRWFVLGGGVGVAAILFFALTNANRMARIGNWLHGTCEGDSCLQSDQGLMGLAEGGWWGVGLGQSRQKWGRLPAAQDDYIFAIIGEELGLIGTLGVLLLFSVLALILFRMITRARDPFIQITIGGVGAWLLGQAFVNMMVVTGMLPVLGVPLPFISSGGSALVASMLALGMLLSFARHEPGAQEALTARMGTVRSALAVIPASRGGEGTRRRRRGRRGAKSAGGASSRKTKATAGTAKATTTRAAASGGRARTAAPSSRSRGAGARSSGTRTTGSRGAGSRSSGARGTGTRSGGSRATGGRSAGARSTGTARRTPARPSARSAEPTARPDTEGYAR
ncbi:putative lipid II flippase FtsW [Brachybacterium halotolerans subsp. kimchii]|uniref:putative lipid II flippase FtsW n=1 Tax=Brachybacterium halotolerans TaxID=2795215 RepID=UPI001E4F3A6A|nr:putative lipid II flippase FtsW [Brachybacterium halotolerans]UEJ83654.1 putative lipid II flippase FtsW [Brachybacterium halotolerans subsp. kimchii]